MRLTGHVARMEQTNSLLTPGPRHNIVRQYKWSAIYRKEKESEEKLQDNKNTKKYWQFALGSSESEYRPPPPPHHIYMQHPKTNKSIRHGIQQAY
jgi:hypothetical protein